MITVNKKISAMVLGLVIMFAAVMPASAQSSFGGSMSTKKKVGIIGGGAVAGAVIGGLLGGKKGAVVGAVAGGGGGAGYVYYKGKQEEDRYGYYDYRDYRRSRNDGYRGYYGGSNYRDTNYRGNNYRGGNRSCNR